MDTESAPIAYAALQRGRPVHTSDGREFGTVAAVLVDEPVDVFDGINVQTPEGARFVDADAHSCVKGGLMASESASTHTFGIVAATIVIVAGAALASRRPFSSRR